MAARKPSSITTSSGSSGSGTCASSSSSLDELGVDQIVGRWRPVGGRATAAPIRAAPWCRAASARQPRRDLRAYPRQRFGQAVREQAEQLVVQGELAGPAGGIDVGHALEARAIEVEAGPVEIFVARRQPERREPAFGRALDAAHDPFEDAHVLAVAGPGELRSCRLRPCETS